MTKNVDGTLSQDEIDELLTDISCGLSSKIRTSDFEDANDIVCVKSNLKRVKTPQDHFDLILEFVKERQHYRELLQRQSQEINQMKQDLKMAKYIIDKTLLSYSEEKKTLL